MDDRRDIAVPGATPPAQVLRSDPIYALLGSRLTNPFVLGVTCALIVLAMMLFSASTESRFIYTDF